MRQGDSLKAKMNVISSSYYSAVRQHGVCQGTLWCQPDSAAAASPASKKKKKTASATHVTTTTTLGSTTTCDYCVLAGSRLDCFESRCAARGGSQFRHFGPHRVLSRDGSRDAFGVSSNVETLSRCLVVRLSSWTRTLVDGVVEYF